MTTPRRPLGYLTLAEVTPQRPSQEDEIKPPYVMPLDVGATGSDMSATGGPGYVVYQNGVGAPFTSGPAPSAAGESVESDGLPPLGVGPRPILNFQTSFILFLPITTWTVTDDPANSRINISANLLVGNLLSIIVPLLPSSYSTIDDEGTPLPQHSVMNFIGMGVTAQDNAPNARTDILVGALQALKFGGLD